MTRIEGLTDRVEVLELERLARLTADGKVEDS